MGSWVGLSQPFGAVHRKSHHAIGRILYKLVFLRFFFFRLSKAMSYQCILVLTLSLLAASVSLANPAATDKAAASSSALPKAQDPLFNKMLAEKPSIPMAQDPRFNKMYPEVDSKENDIEDEAKDALLPKKPAADLNPKYAQHAAILKKLDKVEQQKQPKAESTTVGTHRKKNVCKTLDKYQYFQELCLSKTPRRRTVSTMKIAMKMKNCSPTMW